MAPDATQQPTGAVGSDDRWRSRFRLFVAARPRVTLLGVGLLALLVRVTAVLRSNLVHGTFGYDSGVYFAGADAFVHGRLPYRDFVLLHPPVLMCVLAPFAALTKVLSDSVAFDVALIAFCGLGAVNAALVVAVCRRLETSVGASAAGGVFYAVWFGAVGTDTLIKLETLANTVLLVAVLALLRARARPTTGAAVLAGFVVGVFATVKIWDAVPAVLLLVWFAATARDRRRGVAAGCGAVAGGVAVNLPFFLAAPAAMWSSVVADQLGRPSSATGTLRRLADLSTVPRFGPLSSTAAGAAAVLFVLFVVAVCVRAWRVRPYGSALVVLLGAQLLVLLASPSWFVPYCAYLAVPLSVVVAAAIGPTARSRIPAGGLVVAAGVVMALLLALPIPRGASVPDAGRLARAVAGYRCVMSDTPILQIRLDTLSRDLRAGCPEWIDVTGRTYGPDRGPGPRTGNARWQRDLRRYLTSGSAVVIGRAAGTGITPATHRFVARGGVLVRAGRTTVYRTAPRLHRHPHPPDPD